MKISIDTEKLTARSNEIRLLNTEINKIMNDIEALVISTNGEWQGDSERAFSSNIIYVKKEFAGITAFLADYSNLLQKFADGYDEADDGLCLKVKSIS